jgi:hypothetical protein
MDLVILHGLYFCLVFYSFPTASRQRWVDTRQAFHYFSWNILWICFHSVLAASFFCLIFSKSISIEDFIPSQCHSRQPKRMAHLKLFVAYFISLVDIPVESVVVFLLFYEMLCFV